MLKYMTSLLTKNKVSISKVIINLFIEFVEYRDSPMPICIVGERKRKKRLFFHKTLGLVTLKWIAIFTHSKRCRICLTVKNVKKMEKMHFFCLTRCIFKTNDFSS